MENDVNKIIGKNLLNLRKQNKLTQLELAEKLSYSDKSISKWEKGESLPSIEILCELAKFYNVTLNDLVNEEEIVSTSQPQPKTRREKFFPAKLCITLLATSAIWLIATVLFVSLKLGLNKNFFTLFMWAVPASCVILIIFNSIWGKPRWLFVILTVLIWTFITSLYLQLLKFNIWPIYILGIPLQVAVVLSLALTKPRNKQKQEKKPNQNKEKHSNNKKSNKSKPISDGEQTLNYNKDSEQNTLNTSHNLSNQDDSYEIPNLEKDYNQSFEQPKSDGKIEVSLPQISKMPNQADKK